MSSWESLKKRAEKIHEHRQPPPPIQIQYRFGNEEPFPDEDETTVIKTVWGNMLLNGEDNSNG